MDVILGIYWQNTNFIFILVLLFPVFQNEYVPPGGVGSIKTKLATLCYNGNKSSSSSEIVRLPVPYQLPPLPYTSEGSNLQLKSCNWNGEMHFFQDLFPSRFSWSIHFCFVFPYPQMFPGRGIGDTPRKTSMGRLGLRRFSRVPKTLHLHLNKAHNLVRGTICREKIGNCLCCCNWFACMRLWCSVASNNLGGFSCS